MSTVLVVDDSLTVRMDLAQAFESSGARVVACGTLAEARAAWSRERVDVAVLDVLLPDGDGIELLRELRDDSGGAELVVLVLSTEAEVRDRIRGLETGADDFVGKPYDAGYVVARAEELARRRRADAPASAPILLVDDSATYRAALRHEFEAAGHVVLTAASGEEGLRLAAGARPAAIVVDGVLPGIDGPTFVRRVRLDAALRGTPCLLLTAAEDGESELRALDAGADGFVRKQEEPGVILARLGALLRGRAAETSPTASLLDPKRILAVDDDPARLNELAAALRGGDLDVVLARSGAEALEILAVQASDAIVMRQDMADLGGGAACERIKSVPGLRDVPLILLTRGADAQATLDGLAAGADDCVDASSGATALHARLRAQLRRRQFEDERREIREELLLRELDASRERARRELAETRAAMADELARRNRDLEAFSSSVSHDLRAPLRTISAFGAALLEDPGNVLTESSRHYAERIGAAARRMSELIEALLQLARTSRAKVERARVSLSELAGSVVEDLRRREPDHAVDVVIAPGVEVEGDRTLLRAVLDNLLGNAWKFSAKVASPRVEFGVVERDGERWHFVRDNGAGFDMAQVDRLFRPFERLHATTEFAGIGIGLATVQRILEHHGGRIVAESEAGRGATFSFTVPAAAKGRSE